MYKETNRKEFSTVQKLRRVFLLKKGDEKPRKYKLLYIKIFLILEIGSSNLLDNRMYSVVASWIIVLILSLKDGFPNRNVFVKFGKVNLDIWGSSLCR